MAKDKLMTAAEANTVSVKNQDTAIRNIVGLIKKATTAGYVNIHIDPVSEYIAEGLRNLGYKVDTMLVFSQNQVRISW